MSLFSIIGKGIKAMIDEAKTPESFKRGESFEKYVREFLFIPEYYDLLERTHNYSTNKGDFVASSLNPDYKFRDRYTGRVFYVEVKFRSGFLQNDKLEWCNYNQLKRYQQIHQSVPVFLLLGIGDDPQYPEAVSLISLNEARYTGLFPSLIQRHEIHPEQPIKSSWLWRR